MYRIFQAFQIFVFLSLTSVVLPVFANQPINCGREWINIHKKNPDLIGVYVQQSPDNIADEIDYRGKHPSLVVYVFKNGKDHSVSYTPSGQVEDGYWSDVLPGDWIYGHLNKNLKDDVFCAYWVKK